MRHKPPFLPPQFVPPLTPVNQPIHRCSVMPEAASLRIMIMRLGAHGDILMGTPLLSALRSAHPDAHITWIVERKEREAIDANPYVDELLLWESGYWKRIARRGFYPLWLLQAGTLRTELRRRRFDVFISFQPEEWPAVVRDVAAPSSIGVFDTFRDFYRAAQTSKLSHLYRSVFAFPNLPVHRTDQYLLPLRALGLPETADKQMQIGYTAEDDDFVHNFLAEHAIREHQPFIILAPMTTWPSRCWSAARYAELGDALAVKHDCPILMIGSKKEQEAVAQIAAQMRHTPILAAGILGFRQMAALIAHASLLVSGDTGPMHVAGAVKTPYLALFGPTPREGRVPLAGPGIALMHPVPCGPCDQKICPNTDENHMLCMRLITTSEALDAANALLSNISVTR